MHFGEAAFVYRTTSCHALVRVLTISCHSYALYFSPCAVFPTSSLLLSFPSVVQYVDIHPHAAPYSLTLYQYIVSFISSLLFDLATLYTSLTTFYISHCHTVKSLLNSYSCHSFQVIQLFTHKYTIDLLCHFVISNSNPSHYLFTHFHHAPYSYYTHASMS